MNDYPSLDSVSSDELFGSGCASSMAVNRGSKPDQWVSSEGSSLSSNVSVVSLNSGLGPTEMLNARVETGNSIRNIEDVTRRRPQRERTARTDLSVSLQAIGVYVPECTGLCEVCGRDRLAAKRCFCCNQGFVCEACLPLHKKLYPLHVTIPPFSRFSFCYFANAVARRMKLTCGCSST